MHKGTLKNVLLSTPGSEPERENLASHQCGMSLRAELACAASHRLPSLVYMIDLSQAERMAPGLPSWSKLGGL